LFVTNPSGIFAMSVLPSSVAAPSADDDNHPLFVSFTVQAHPEPGVMPRVVELFAKRGLVPQTWHSTAAGQVLTIEVTVGGLGRELCEYIARCMRQITGVDTVLTSERRSSG
jgi:acetolactate synthase small subunit